MGWKLIDKPKTVLVTKKLAKQFAEMDPAPHDRPLSEKRLTVYAKLLNEKKFRPVTWASAICEETGNVYRVNGKHTSTLLAGIEKTPEFYVTIEEYECPTLEDVAQLYATFDSAIQSRSARDIYLSFAGTIPELKEVPSKFIQVAVAGMSYAKMGADVYGASQPAERAEMLIEHPQFVLWMTSIFSGAATTHESGIASKSKLKCAHMIRQPVAAAMFASWEKAKGAATEFWTSVRDESGTNPQGPDRKIGRFLLTIGMAERPNRSKAKTAGLREIYVKCLHAWNAWRKGETTNLNYFANAKVPTVH